MNELLAELNNVDKALARSPDADPWTDDGERSEVTGTAGQLTWGRPADKHFAAAHAAGAALRELRRQGRPTAAPPEERAKWLGPEFDYEATRLAIQNGEPVDYWDFLEVAKKVTKGKNPSQRPAVDEWRQVPGFPSYIMHSITRELWRSAREEPRRLPAKKVTARNGSYTLSGPGGVSSRGINALYRQTFPELFPKTKRKKKLGEWADEIRVGNKLLERVEGVAEWVAGGAARVIEKHK